MLQFSLFQRYRDVTSLHITSVLHGIQAILDIHVVSLRTSPLLSLASSEVASYANTLWALGYRVTGPKSIFVASYLKNALLITQPLQFPEHDGEKRELPY